MVQLQILPSYEDIEPNMVPPYHLVVDPDSPLKDDRPSAARMVDGVVRLLYVKVNMKLLFKGYFGSHLFISNSKLENCFNEHHCHFNLSEQSWQAVNARLVKLRNTCIDKIDKN